MQRSDQPTGIDLEKLRRHRERVVETIRRTASWRRAKADEFPENAREDSRAAQALRTLANFVENMAPDDLDLRAMRWSRLAPDGATYALTPDARDLLGRFGMSYRSWNEGVPDERALRNVLRRVEGVEARARHAARDRAAGGYGNE